MKLKALIAVNLLLLISLRAEASIPSHPFLQCHPPVSSAAQHPNPKGPVTGLCSAIPSIDWQECATQMLLTLANDDSHWHGPSPSVTIIDDKNPNAFLVSNRSMIITTGLTTIINSGSELAFILAHEMAHALLAECSKYHLNETLHRSCIALFTRTPLTNDSQSLEQNLHEIRADHAALVVMRDLSWPTQAPIALLSNMAEYQLKNGNTGHNQLKARIDSLRAGL